MDYITENAICALCSFQTYFQCLQWQCIQSAIFVIKQAPKFKTAVYLQLEAIS